MITNLLTTVETFGLEIVLIDFIKIIDELASNAQDNGDHDDVNIYDDLRDALKKAQRELYGNNPPIDKFIPAGTEMYFEYSFGKSENNYYTQLLNHTHQKVVVGKCGNAKEYGHLTQQERFANCTPLAYIILFDDGFEGETFEDELFTNESEYNYPPKNKSAKD